MPRHKDHLKPTALQQLLNRCPRIRQLVDPDQNPTRSPLEDDFLRWIRRHKLPMPVSPSYPGLTDFLSNSESFHTGGWCH
jgi:hypothetical protein